MMFMNPRPIDLECCEEADKGKHRTSSVRHRHGGARGSGADPASNNLQRVTFIILAIYLFLSACLALFSYPLSITSVILPLLVVTITICAAMNSRTGSNEETLWFCAIASALGGFTKIVAIIAFSSIFGFTRSLANAESRRRKEMMQSPQSKEDALKSDRWLTHFFVILLVGEAVLMLLIACLRCNLNFFKRCFRLDPD